MYNLDSSHLFALKFDVGSRLFDDVFENGRERRDANAATDQDTDVIAVPVLVTLSIRPVHKHLYIIRHLLAYQ